MIAAILIAGTYPSRNKQSRGSKRVERIGRKNKGGKEVIIERIYHVEEESWGRKVLLENDRKWRKQVRDICVWKESALFLCRRFSAMELFV